MIDVDGEPSPRDELSTTALLLLPPLRPRTAEKPCGCHPTMPDVTVHGGVACLGCGWGATTRSETP